MPYLQDLYLAMRGRIFASRLLLLRVRFSIRYLFIFIVGVPLSSVARVYACMIDCSFSEKEQYLLDKRERERERESGMIAS